MKHSSIRQFKYHVWANQRLFEHLKSLPDESIDRQVESVFSSIREVLDHISQVDTLWLSVMSGDSFQKTMDVIKLHEGKAAGLSLNEIQHLFGETVQSYTRFFERLKDPDEQITIRHPRFGSLETSVAELVYHVVNHGTYHRGNITAMLRQMGYAGVPTDYVFFLAGQRRH
jgi:uncharacterized damage-inducible protein DinB